MKWACDQFKNNNLSLLIEPINQRNIPKYFLSSTDLAIEIINKVERDNINLLFDIYHHQILRGDVSKYLEKSFLILVIFRLLVFQKGMNQTLVS